MSDASVRVATTSGQYDVHVGPNLLESVGERAREAVSGGRVAQISDDRVEGLYGEAVTASLRESGFDVEHVVVPAGESSKTWFQAGEILEELASARLDRTDGVVALGGGVIGDLAGFCAATYLRGVDLVQVPTTLLSQVDSSVGGKTAVDLAAGKNLAGVFKQPGVVIADTVTLETLPDIEWRSGLAEVVKTAILDGYESLEWMERHAGALAAHETDVAAEAVMRCVSFKAGVVGADEKEAGPRESLNLGHTLGHALEKVAGYGEVAHGLAVAEGIRFAARLAERVVDAAPGLADRQGRLLDAVGLERSGAVYDINAVREAMLSDKKVRGGRPRFVLMVEPGEYVVTHVDDSVLEGELERWSTEAKLGGQ
jgi:3-dehydroquinate synthase